MKNSVCDPQGISIDLPCLPGDTIYVIERDRILQAYVDRIKIDENLRVSLHVWKQVWGKNWREPTEITIGSDTIGRIVFVGPDANRHAQDRLRQIMKKRHERSTKEELNQTRKINPPYWHS